MRLLSASELLRVWDEGRVLPPTERALLLLAAACPEEDPGSLAALPVGRRDERLLMLREWTFGSSFSGLARCPSCGERVEASFTAGEVRARAPAEEDHESVVTVDGYRVTFRLPDSADLTTLYGFDDAAAAKRHLLGRCLLEARRSGKRLPVGRLPAKVIAAVDRRMAELDPQADTQAAVHCPACAHAWHAAFDIVAFFWAEIEGWAWRTLRDVHVLASAYSWTEAEILALSPARRGLYLQMING